MKDFYDIWFLAAVSSSMADFLGPRFALHSHAARPSCRLPCPSRLTSDFRKRPAEEDPVAGLRSENASAKRGARSGAGQRSTSSLSHAVLAALAQTNGSFGTWNHGTGWTKT